MRTIIVYLFALAPFLAFGQIDSTASAVPLEEVISTEAVAVDSVLVDSVTTDAALADSVATEAPAPSDSLIGSSAAGQSPVDLAESATVAGGSLNVKSDTIKWEYGEIENKRNQEKLAFSGHIITYGDKGVLWVQNGYATSYPFEIKSLTGEWEVLERKGEVVYQVTYDGFSGYIKLFRRGNNLWLSIDFSEIGPLSPNIDVKITNYSKI